MIHRIKSQLGRISKSGKQVEDELPIEPPEENARLVRWVEQFIPAEHRAHVSARLKHLLLEKNAAEFIWESTEASSGHVVVQRDVRQRRRGELSKQKGSSSSALITFPQKAFFFNVFRHRNSILSSFV
jgi:hypothetical protein